MEIIAAHESVQEIVRLHEVTKRAMEVEAREASEAHQQHVKEIVAAHERSRQAEANKEAEMQEQHIMEIVAAHESVKEIVRLHDMTKRSMEVEVERKSLAE